MAGYIGNIPTPQATQSRQSFTATASQTTFATIGYTPNYVDVYLNGVHLLDGTDYTATNSSDVVLTVGAAVSDVIEVISYETFAVLDQTFVGATEVTSDGTTTLTVSSTGTGDADALLVLDSADGGESEVRFFHDGVHGASIQWYTDGSPDLNISTVAGTDGVIDFQPNNSFAVRIDSSGNVGIGTSSPKTSLDLSSSTGPQITLTRSDTSNNLGNTVGRLNFYNSDLSGDGANNAAIIEAIASTATGAAADLLFRTKNTGVDGADAAEAMRIDSSGNVLVGKTASDFNTQGFEINSGGQLRNSRASGSVAFLNRKTDDGSIVDFGKDGTVVGSIGTAGSTVYVGSDDTNIIFDSGGTPKVGPAGTAGAASNGVIDLGDSGSRFKDLYLSGGVYLGGTGSANKLDDYEEGTWNPTYIGSTGNPTITYDPERSASYIKVGKIVFIQGSIKTDAASGGSGNLYLGGLPFTSGSNTNPKRKGGMSVSGYQTSFSGAVRPTGGYIGTDVNHVILMSNRPTESAATVQTTALANTVNDNFMMFYGQYVID